MNAVSSQTFDEASSGGILSFPNCRGAWADAASPADGVTQIQTDTMTEANRNRTTRWRECFHAWFLSPPISYSFRESGTKPQTDRHPPEKTLTLETGQRLQSGCCSRFDVKRQTDKRRQVSCHSGFLPQTTTVSWVPPREHGESDWIWEWNQSELTPPDNCGCLNLSWQTTKIKAFKLSSRRVSSHVNTFWPGGRVNRLYSFYFQESFWKKMMHVINKTSNLLRL